MILSDSKITTGEMSPTMDDQMQLGTCKKIAVDSQSWIARRGGKALGAFIELDNNSSMDKKGNPDSSIRIGRIPLSTQMEEIAAAVKYQEQGTSYIVTLDLRCGPQYSSTKRRITVEFFHTFSHQELSDPFSLGESGGPSIKFELELNEEWRNVSVLLNFEELRPSLVLRLRINDFLDPNPRSGDWIEFRNVNVKSCSSQLRISSLLSSSPNVEQEIITPYVRVIKRKSAECLTTFSPVDFPPYKYNTFDLFAGIAYSRVFISDPTNSWYNDGIPGLGTSIAETLEEMKKIHDFLGPKHLTTFGASMGGYGAVLFGTYLNAGTIVAFNPELRLGVDGERNTGFMGAKKHSIPDLYARVLEHTGKKFLFFSSQDRFDKLHMEEARFKLGTNVSLYSISSGHQIKSILNDYHWLSHLIEKKSLNAAYLNTNIEKL